MSGIELSRLLISFRQSPKKTVVLCGLLPLMLLAWLPVLRGADRRAVPRAATPPVAVAGTAVQTSPPPAPALEVRYLDMAALGRRIERIRQPFTPRWKASPALDPFGAARLRAEDPEPEEEAVVVTAQALVPTSIYLSKTRPPVAIIRGQWYGPGDELEGFVIAAIEERRVLYRRDGRLYAVPIPEPEAKKERKQK